jgi:proteasome lid subunit RPN8/RPN11
MIHLPGALERSLAAEGEKAYPHECCGFILGLPGEDGRKRVTGLLPVDNAREPAERYHRFRIEPEDFMRAEIKAGAEGREVLGFYHSHPDHPARPSAYDLELALPFYLYLIIAVAGGRAGELTGWELASDRSAFNPREIVVSN